MLMQHLMKQNYFLNYIAWFLWTTFFNQFIFGILFWCLVTTLSPLRSQVTTNLTILHNHLSFTIITYTLYFFQIKYYVDYSINWNTHFVQKYLFAKSYVITIVLKFDPLVHPLNLPKKFENVMDYIQSDVNSVRCKCNSQWVFVAAVGGFM